MLRNINYLPIKVYFKILIISNDVKLIINALINYFQNTQTKSLQILKEKINFTNLK